MRKYCVFKVKVPLESENEQTAAEGLRVTVSMSGLTAFLQVLRASNIKVSKRLQRGVGDGSREVVRLHFYSAPWLLIPATTPPHHHHAHPATLHPMRGGSCFLRCPPSVLGGSQKQMHTHCIL